MIAPQSIVELKPDAEGLYEYASAGARAFVLSSKMDEYGFEQVKIQWDRDCWRTDNESDRWAYALHFNVLNEIADIPVEYDDEDVAEDYIASIEVASKMAAGGEGFLLLSLRRGGDGEIYPEIALGSSTDEMGMCLEQEILPMLGFDEEDE